MLLYYSQREKPRKSACGLERFPFYRVLINYTNEEWKGVRGVLSVDGHQVLDTLFFKRDYTFSVPLIRHASVHLNLENLLYFPNPNKGKIFDSTKMIERQENKYEIWSSRNALYKVNVSLSWLLCSLFIRTIVKFLLSDSVSHFW